MDIIVEGKSLVLILFSASLNGSFEDMRSKTFQWEKGGMFPRVFGDKFGDEFGDKFSELLNLVIIW